jgi:deoxyribonuclease V
MSGLPIDIPNLTASLDALLRQIPKGRVTTYGDLARALGNVLAARWVATVLLEEHRHTARCPCHRVVRQGGDIGLYVTGDAREKSRRLEAEGIAVVDGRVDVERFGFNAFKSDRPLEQLQQLQDEIARQVSQVPPAAIPEFVGAVDLAYPDPQTAVGAYSLVEVATGKLVWSTTLRHAVVFPYIPTFLTFRELPTLLPLLNEVREQGRLSEVVIVDGNGLLHQRLAGIATHCGVAAGVRTIGVGKSLLCGTVDLHGFSGKGSRPVVYEGRTVAQAMQATPRSKPIYVSVGNGVDLPFAVQVVEKLFHGHRLPEPLFWADKLSKAAAREKSG